MLTTLFHLRMKDQKAKLKSLEELPLWMFLARYSYQAKELHLLKRKTLILIILHILLVVVYLLPNFRSRIFSLKSALKMLTIFTIK